MADRPLVVCQASIAGERRLSLIRASSVVKRHSMAHPVALRAATQAATSRASVERSARRRSRHWR